MAAKTRNDVLRVNLDPALGDLALAEARDALASGDWGPAREVLAETRKTPAGTQWDRRSHRVRVLAEAVANSSWVERWQVLEPVNPDAALLRAQVETVRTLRAALAGRADCRETAEEALDLCEHAAEMAPEDPTPWVVMLTLARAADRGSRRGHDEFWNRWQKMRALDEFNRDGQHEALMYLFDAWCGSHKEMYDFAYWLAGEAPPGSPLAALPLVAHAEVYRTANLGVPRTRQSSPQAHWSRDLVRADIDRVMNSWLGSAIEPHAQADLDRNYLLHAMVYSGLVDTDETRALFDAIGSHAMRIPWSYTGDPESSFLYWRDQAFHADSPRDSPRR